MKGFTFFLNRIMQITKTMMRFPILRHINIVVVVIGLNPIARLWDLWNLHGIPSVGGLCKGS